MAGTDPDSVVALRQGNALFGNGEYEQAVAAYLVALRGGFRSSLLFHNMGVSFYRMQRFSEAKAAFNKSSQDMAFFDLAMLNLALVAVRENNLGKAVKYLQAVDAQRSPERVYTAAQTLLQRINSEQALRAEPLILFVFGSFGYEDTGVSDNQDTVTPEGNSFTDLSAYGAWRGLGRSAHYLDIFGTAYVLENSEQNAIGLKLATAGLEWGGAGMAWSRKLSASYSRMALNDKNYQSSLELMPWLRWRANRRHTFTWRYQWQWQQSLAQEFDSTRGERHRARFSFRYGRPLHGTRLIAEWEENKRDLFVDAIAVYAPRRWLWRAEYRAPLFSGNATLRLDYRRSEDNLGDRTERQDERRIAVWRWERALGKAFEFGVEYEYFSQDSTQAVYTFDRHRLSLLWTWQYLHNKR